VTVNDNAENKAIVVAGASSGLGEATARPTRQEY